MSLVPMLNAYLTLNLLIIVCYFLFKVINFSSIQKLKLQYQILGLIFLLPCLQTFLPRTEFTNSTIKVWAAPTMEEFKPGKNNKKIDQVIGFSQPGTQVSTGTFSTVISLALGLFILLALFQLIRESLMLKRLKSQSFVYRKFGKVTLLLNEEIKMPFSFWQPGHYYSILPISFLERTDDFKVSFYHELQHHRQGDTKWIYLVLALRSLCFLNPFAHLLAKSISETQELACDEAVLKRKNVTTFQYISCLLRVAETAVTTKSDPVCAAGFCFNQGRHILKRRIEMMNLNYRPVNKLKAGATLLLLTSLITFTAFASRNMVQDRSISMEEARAIVEKTQTTTDFPVVVNEQVLDQLNKFLGTPEGRVYMKTALSRKDEYNSILTDAVRTHGTPAELNAIPVTESGYRNLPARGRARAAGLWMFIPSTARRYGMTVGKGMDERLNVVKETNAAHKYLNSNHLIFNDWLLAIFAYNVGENAVAMGISKHHTRDVWELSKHIRGDKDYLQKVMATIIIMKNPELLD